MFQLAEFSNWTLKVVKCKTVQKCVICTLWIEGEVIGGLSLFVEELQPETYHLIHPTVQSHRGYACLLGVIPFKLTLLDIVLLAKSSFIAIVLKI